MNFERLHAMQSTVTYAFLQSSSPEAAVSTALRVLCETLDWSFGAVWRPDASDGLLRCSGAWHLPDARVDEFAAALRNRTFAPGEGLPGAVWSEEKPIWIGDLLHDPNFPRAKVAEDAGFHSAMGFPICTHHQILGVMEFFSSEPLPDDPILKEAMETIGHQLGLFIERHESEARATEESALKTALLESSLDAIVGMDANGIVMEWNGAAERLFGYRRDEALGLDMADLIIPARLQEAHRQGLRRYLATGEGVILGKRIEIQARRRDDSEFEVELTISRVSTSGPPLFTGHLRDLTLQKQTETRLQEASRNASTILESITDAFFTLDREWRFTYANRESERVLQKTRDELLGRTLWEVFPKAVGSVFERVYRQAMQDQVPAHFEGLSQHLNTWLELNAYPSPDSLAIYFRDINERKMSEENLRRSEERYRVLAEAMPQIVWLADDTGRITYMNDHWLAFTGLDRQVAEEQGWGNVLHPDDLALTLEKWSEALEAGTPYEVECRLRGADGAYLWHLIRGLPMKNTSGVVEQWIGTNTNIDDQKRALEAAETARLQAKAAEDQLRLITDALPALISYVDREYRYRLNNKTYEKWLGIVREDIQGKKLWEVQGPNLWSRVRTYAERAMSGETVTFETPLRHSDHGVGWFSVTYVPHLNDSGVVEGYAALGTDVTERKRNEDSLRLLADASGVLGSSLDPDEVLRTLAKLSVPRLADWCAIDVLNEDGTLRRLAVEHSDPEKVAAAFEIQKRYPPRPDAPRGVYHILRSGEPEYIPHVTSELLEMSAQDEEHLRLLREVGIRSVIAVPLTARGQTFGAITLVTAESERIYREEDLAFVQDLANRAAVAVENTRLYRDLQEAAEAKDRFIAMMAHELRNPLGAATNASQVMRLADPSSAAYGRAQSVLDRQLAHQRHLVDELLDVSRLQREKVELELSLLSLSQIAAETAEDHRPAIEEAGLRFTVELPEKPVTIRGNRTRLVQVLGNLLDNARKFTPSGGEIRIHLELQEDAGQALLTVEDTGSGISAELLPTIWEPFTQADRSLHRSSGGLGLGLALVKGWVELHRGSIRVESSEGNGTRFTLAFPLASDIRGIPGDPTVAPSRTELRVLVIEDMDDAARSLGDMLELFGYHVEIATTGMEGLLKATRFRPDIVLCDVGLPEISGYEVAAQLRENPQTRHLRLIALTGYGTEEDIRKSQAAGFDLHLTKPVQPEKLQQALQSG